LGGGREGERERKEERERVLLGNNVHTLLVNNVHNGGPGRPGDRRGKMRERETDRAREPAEKDNTVYGGCGTEMTEPI